MRGIPFPEVNLTLTAPAGMEDQVYPLQVLRVDGLLISCWSVSPAELATIRNTGKIWLSVMGDQHPPVSLSGDRPFTVTPEPRE